MHKEVAAVDATGSDRTIGLQKHEAVSARTFEALARTRSELDHSELSDRTEDPLGESIAHILHGVLGQSPKVEFDSCEP